jgi:hypothetical protein
MDSKAILSNKKKINELAVQHNKLTTLVACLLNEIGSLKREISVLKNGSEPTQINTRNISNDIRQQQQTNPNKFPNFNELRAEDILKQLSINSSSDN